MSLESLGKLLKAEKYQDLVESSENKLVERGYIKTKFFGWISQSEADWLDKKLKEENFSKTVEELEGIPSFTKEVTVGKGKDMTTKIITVVCPFVDKFYEMRRARDARLRALE